MIAKVLAYAPQRHRVEPILLVPSFHVIELGKVNDEIAFVVTLNHSELQGVEFDRRWEASPLSVRFDVFCLLCGIVVFNFSHYAEKVFLLAAINFAEVAAARIEKVEVVRWVHFLILQHSEHNSFVNVVKVNSL